MTQTLESPQKVPPESSQKLPCLDSFEARRQWMEIAGNGPKSSRNTLQRQAESGAFQAYSPKATPQAVAEFSASFLKDPGKIAVTKACQIVADGDEQVDQGA